MTTASTTDTVLENSRRLQSKEKLKNFFSSENADDGCLICPESLSPLIRQTRVFGLFSEKYWSVEGFPEIKYPINAVYCDMTVPAETQRSFFSLTNRERVGQNFFQNPVLPFVYE